VINTSFNIGKRSPPVTHAVVYVLTRYLEADTSDCAAYCAAMGYKIAAIVKDDYHAALHALCLPGVTVLVVARAERLTDQCTPRTEIAGGPPVPPPADAQHRRRRTSRLFRPGAAA
jgi:hypothetical protein